MKKLLNKIGHFFSNLFNGAEKTWKQLSPEIKNAMLHGSDIMATINNNLDAVPQFIIDAVTARFPDLTREKMHEGLVKALDGLTIAENASDLTLEELIVAMQKHMATLKGKLWARVSQFIALGYAAAVAPPTTKFAALAALMEYAYQTFIKKDVPTLPPAGVPADPTPAV